jgi:hypothetical protein
MDVDKYLETFDATKTVLTPPPYSFRNQVGGSSYKYFW